MSEPESENSGINRSRPIKKKAKIDQENSSESEGMNIKLKQFLFHFEIKEKIFISGNNLQNKNKY